MKGLEQDGFEGSVDESAYVGEFVWNLRSVVCLLQASLTTFCITFKPKRTGEGFCGHDLSSCTWNWVWQNLKKYFCGYYFEVIPWFYLIGDLEAFSAKQWTNDLGSEVVLTYQIASFTAVEPLRNHS